MARKEIKTFEITDDLTGETIAEDDVVTMQFSYGGTSYEIDLSKENAAKFDSLIQPYQDAARRVRGGNATTTKPRKSSGAAGSSLQEIRDWANANGHAVSARGRISADVLSAYRQARAGA